MCTWVMVETQPKLKAQTFLGKKSRPTRVILSNYFSKTLSSFTIYKKKPVDTQVPTYVSTYKYTNI